MSLKAALLLEIVAKRPKNFYPVVKRPKNFYPDQMADPEVKRADLEAAQANKLAAVKIMDAAVLISSCVK